MIRCVHLMTGPTGHSHVEYLTLPIGTVQQSIAVHFQESPAGSALDWHTAPHVQYVITLSGTFEFTTRDSETFVLRPDEVLLAADTTGTARRWRLIDDRPWRRLYVELCLPTWGGQHANLLEWQALSLVAARGLILFGAPGGRALPNIGFLL
jgi:hypothetical protein